MASLDTAPLTDRRLTLLCLTLASGMFITLLDTTIVNIALDTLQTVFAASVGETQWVATGYLLAVAATIPVSGWLSERFGARGTWLAAIAVFLLGSVLSGLATSMGALTAFRVLQGVGAGLVMPITLSIATRAAGPARVARATAVVGLPGLLGPILGNVVGGAILESSTWNWLFLLNIPVCVLALTAGWLLLPADAPRRGHRFDAVGFALLTPGVVAVAYGVSSIPESARDAWAPLAIGVVLLTAFSVHSLRRRRTALIDVTLFGRRSFAVAGLITFFAGFSTYALSFLLPLYYQRIRGESVLSTGLLLIAGGLGTMLFFVVFRGVAARLGARVVVAGGVALTMAGTVPFALAGAGGDALLLLGGQLLQGFGFAATTFPVLALAMAGLDHEEAPHGSAAFSVVQRIGAPFGVAVVAVILQSLLTGSVTSQDAVEAFQGTFWWIVGLSAVPLALALALPSGRSGTAHPEAVAD